MEPSLKPACDICQASEDLRTCDTYHRPVCRSCTLSWPMDELAIKWGRATCRPCVDPGARRMVEEVREMLRRQGLEDLESAPPFEEFGL